MSVQSLQDRLSTIKSDSNKGPQPNRFKRETKPLENNTSKKNLLTKEMNRGSGHESGVMGRGTSSKPGLNPGSNDTNISSLVSVIMGSHRLNSPTVSQGTVGELYTLYQQTNDLNKKYENVSLDIGDQLEKARLRHSTLAQRMNKSHIEEENKNRIALQENLDRLEYSVISKSKLIKQEIEKEINEIETSYERGYNEELDNSIGVAEDLSKLIADFGIPRTGIVLPEDIDLDTLNPEELIEIAIEDANTINTLEDVGEEMSSVQLEELFSNRNNKIKTTGILALGTVFTTITFSVALINLGKRILNATRVRKLVKTLEEEILLCERLANLKIKEIENNYNPPDLSAYRNELRDVENTVRDEYGDQLISAKNQLDEFMNGAEERNRELKRKTSIYSERSNQDYEELVKELGLRKKSIENEREYVIQTYSDKREEFMNRQIQAQFNEEELVKKMAELETTMKEIRIINDYNLLSSLSYQKEIDPNEDDPMVIMRYEYDQELLQRLDKLTKQVKELEEQNKTSDVLENQRVNVERGMDDYYLLDTSGKHMGEHFISQEVKTQMGVNETATHDLKNRSIVFVYQSPEEEDFIVDYVKYLTQQLLFTCHPESIKVNIFNKTRSNKFNNLQVNLDTFNEKTREMEKGMPYCEIYSETTDMRNIIKEQLSRLSDMNSTDMLDKNFNELILHRREIGGIVPNYHLNILHREGMENEIVEVSSESADNGIINYMVIPRNELFEIDKEGKPAKNKSSEAALENFDLLVEVKEIAGTKVLYLTDYKENTISRILYEPRTRKEVTEVGKKLKERALGILKRKSFILVKEYIDQVTGGNYWQGSARERIELHLGFIEGDKSRPYPLIMDETNNVHMFFGGTTGGGKSNILGVIVNTLKAMYPPSELDLIYFDFKVVEVGIHAKPFKMPHCSAMTGSSQAEYLISLLNFAFQEMEDRYALMDEYGFQKLSEYLDHMDGVIEDLRKEGKNEEADKIFKNLPRRTILLIDEVAQGFKHPDSAVVETIKEILTKLAEKARAAGMHMILVTQEPSKVPDTLLTLCSIRGCTKASPAVSKAVVGNDFCGRLENQFMGFFGTNNAYGDPSANRRYVVPFNQGEPTKILSKIAYEMSKDDLNRNAVIFNDQDPFDYSAMKRYLNNLNVSIDKLILDPEKAEKSKKVLEGTNFFVGEMAYFMKDFRPLELNLVRGDMQNLAVTSTNKEDIKSHFEMIYKQVAPYADCVPIYCKEIPEYAPVDMFYNNMHNKSLFCPMFGKNILSKDDVYTIEERETTKEVEVTADDGTVTKEIKTTTSLIDKQVYKYNAYQVVKGDIFDRVIGTDDEIALDYYNKDLIRYLSAIVKLRKTQPHVYDIRPLYLIAFDFSTHSAITMNSFPWRELMSVISDANSCGVHLLTFSPTLTALDTRNIFSKMIVGSLMVDERFRDYKDVPTGFCKYVDKLNSTNNRTYKPVKFKKNELTYIEQKKGGVVSA